MWNVTTHTTSSVRLKFQHHSIKQVGEKPDLYRSHRAVFCRSTSGGWIIQEEHVCFKERKRHFSVSLEKKGELTGLVLWNHLKDLWHTVKPRHTFTPSPGLDHSKMLKIRLLIYFLHTCTKIMSVSQKGNNCLVPGQPHVGENEFRWWWGC